MKIRIAEKERMRRQYLWSLQEAQREKDLGFPVISAFHNGCSIAVLEHLSNLDQDQQRQMLALLVKTRNREGLEANGEVLTKADFDEGESFRKNIIRTAQRVDSLLSDGTVADINPVVRLMKKEVRKILAEATGVKPVNQDRDMICELYYVDWSVSVEFTNTWSFGGRLLAAIRRSDSYSRETGVVVSLYNVFFDYLDALGIGPSQYWLRDESIIPTICESVRLSLGRMLPAFPTFFEGLNIED